MANLLQARDIPYETQLKNGVSVSYNLFYGKTSNFAGYRLTLVLRNLGPNPVVFEPRITLQDANGFLIRPYAYEGFVAEASALAGTTVPAMPVAKQPTSYYHTGTITNTATGTTYSYSGTTVSGSSGGFAGGFAQGMAQGAVIRAAHDREEGRLMLRWADAFWLQSSYELPPNSAVSGALFFPAAAVGKLPLRLNVEIDPNKFEFVTTAAG